MVADRAGHLGRIPCALLTTDGLHSNRSLVVVIDKQRDAFGSITWAIAAVQSFVVFFNCIPLYHSVYVGVL